MVTKECRLDEQLFVQRLMQDHPGNCMHNSLHTDTHECYSGKRRSSPENESWMIDVLSLNQRKRGTHPPYLRGKLTAIGEVVCLQGLKSGAVFLSNMCKKLEIMKAIKSRKTKIIFKVKRKR